VSLVKIYQWVEQEFGTPLAIYPQTYRSGYQEGQLNDDGNYWVVLDANEFYDSRRIIWLVSSVKAISEVEGPVALDCPLHLLELAPETNSFWRDRVKQHWKLEAIDEPFRGKCSHTFDLGDCCYCSGYKLELNPHPAGSPLYDWWQDGWLFAQKHYPIPE
jgi:hypothetical protein